MAVSMLALRTQSGHPARVRKTADATQALLADALTSGTPIVAPLFRRLRLLLGGTAFVGAGLVLVATGSPIIGWACVGIFALVLAAGCLETFRPGHIIVTPSSFELLTSFGQRATYELVRCGPFETYRQELQTIRRREIWWVVFDYEGKEPSSWLQRANASMVRHNSQLKPDVFGLSAQPLADMFNRLRLDALDRATPASP